MNGYLIWYLWIITFALVTLSRAGQVFGAGLDVWRSHLTLLLVRNLLIGIGLPLFYEWLCVYELIITPPDELAAPLGGFMVFMGVMGVIALVALAIREARAWIAWIGDYRGASLMRAKRYSEALAVYERLVKRHPKMGRFWASESMALYSLGRGVEALDAIERALTLRLGRAQGWMWKASVLIALQRDIEALLIS